MVAVVHHCVREVEKRKVNKSAAVFSGSQATVKAISSASVYSKLVLDSVMS